MSIQDIIAQLTQQFGGGGYGSSQGLNIEPNQIMYGAGGAAGLTNEQIEHRNNIDYQLDKLYLEYSYQRDSLIMEFYKK